MSSQITHTQSSNIHPLPHILSVNFQQLRPFYSLSQPHPGKRHPTPLQVITTRARESGPKEHRARQNSRVILIQVLMHLGSRHFPIFRALSGSLHRHSLLPKAAFPPSIQPNLGLPRTRPPLTSDINTLLALRFSSILST